MPKSKIYLFEDKIVRTKAIESDVIKFDFFKIQSNFEQSPDIDEIAVVLLHSSFQPSDERETFENILKSEKVPLVLFGGGEDRTNIVNDYLVEMKDTNLYSNILAFLNDFDQNKKINLDILCFGEHYRLEKALMLRSKIVYKLFEKNPIDFINEEDLDKDSLRLLLELSGDIDKYENIINYKSFKYDIFLQRLNKLINKIQYE